VTEARKISFQEAWNSSTIFFVDEELEMEIEASVEDLLRTAQDPCSVCQRNISGIVQHSFYHIAGIAWHF